jgi:hypothetical protein
MCVMRIDLTAEEDAVFNTIRFDPWSGDFHMTAVENGKRVARLVRSLVARKAIPTVRLRYFTDPELFSGGRGKSHQQVFRNNGCTTDEIIFMHPHFFAYLHYFIFGPRIPADVISKFMELAKGPFRKSDSLPQFVRTQTKRLKLDDPRDEFFKLALESGLEVQEARMLRTDAMTAARSKR